MDTGRRTSQREDSARPASALDTADPAEGLDMTTVPLSDGATVWYRKSGVGAPVLHIHGSAYGHRNFEKLTPLMESDFKVIDFDLPGYGLSHGGPRHGMQGLAGQVAGFVRAIGC